MKTGMSLVEMAKRLQTVKETSKDFIVPTEKLVMRVEKESGVNVPVLGFTGRNGDVFKPTAHAHGQIASYLDIPKAYYDRLVTESPALLTENVNHGFTKLAGLPVRGGKSEARMVRTIGGNVRGFLSSRYRRLDAHDMVENIFPVLINAGMEVVASELTERRFFLKAISPKLMGEIKVGDVVQHGLMISTSDVGAGSNRVEPYSNRLVCSNGMVSLSAIKKFHVGKNQSEDDIMELLSDETKDLTDAAFWAQMRDVVLASLRPEVFEQELNRMRAAANEPIKNFDLPQVVELAMRATGVIGEGNKNSILAALASGNEGAGLTQWGLINSFTRAAQSDAIDFEQGVELERAAGKILTLNRVDWNRIAA